MANQSIPTIEVKRIHIKFSRPTKRQLQLVVNTEKEVLKNIPVLQAGLPAFTHQPEQPLHLSKGQTLRIRLLQKYDGNFQFRQGTESDESDVTLSFIAAKKLKLSVLKDYDHIIPDPGRTEIKVTLTMTTDDSMAPLFERSEGMRGSLSNAGTEEKDVAAAGSKKVGRTSTANSRTRQKIATSSPASAPNVPHNEDVEDVWAPACVQRERDDAYSDHSARHSTPARAKARTPTLASGKVAALVGVKERANNRPLVAAETEEEAYEAMLADVVAEVTDDKYVSEEEEAQVKIGKGKAPLPGGAARAQSKRKAADTSETTAEGDPSSTDNVGSQLVLRPLVDAKQVGSALRLANATSSRFFGGASNTTINGGTFDASVHLHTHRHGPETILPPVVGSTLALGSTGHATINLKILFSPRLPPRPRWLIGRDDAVEGIVSCILGAASKRPARIAILGDGGFGKTTLALAALYDERIEARYGSDGRVFISCVGATTPELLITALANGLHVEVAERDSHIFRHVLNRLRSTVGILCLDNFETPWDPASSRNAVEELLQHLAGISSLTLLITTRGTQKPSGVNWEARFQPLTPLDSESAANMFLAVSGQSTNLIDEHAQKLLEAVEYIPLAISILAQLVRDGESPHLLLQRWKEEGTAVLSTGVDDRTSALDASIRLSVNSPRMQEVPSAALLLSMLAFLPAGILETGDIMERLISALPTIQIRRALHTLKRVALVHGPLAKSGTAPRYRLLSPVAEWTTRHLPLSDDMCRAMAICYSGIMAAYLHIDPSHRATVVPELLNTRTILHAALDRKMVQQQIIDGVIEYSWWADYMGEDSMETVRVAISRATGPEAEASPRHLGDLHIRLEALYKGRKDWSAAETAVKTAIVLHQQSQDALAEAADLYILGELCGKQGRDDDAQSALDAALMLHLQEGYTDGEAEYQLGIGQLHMQRDRLDDALSAFEVAMRLYQKDQNTYGEAQVHEILGELHLQRDRLDDARSAFEVALELYQQEGHTVGEAIVQHFLLGPLHLRQGSLDDAQSALEAALELYRQAGPVVGEAKAQQNLGELHLRRGRLDDAQSAFEAAVVLHRQIGDKSREARAQQGLGQLHLKQGRLDDAQNAFETAVALHHQAEYALGEADTRQSLGELHLQQGRLDDAQSAFEAAVTLHRQAGSKYGEAKDHQNLGELHQHQGRFDNAQSAFEAAVALHRQAGSKYGEAKDHQNLGELHLQQGRLDNAQSAFEAAVALHRQAGSKHGEAEDQHSLGQLHLKQGRLDDAQTSFEAALELIQWQGQEIYWLEANIQQNLGKLHLQRGRLNDAQSAFEAALELYRLDEDTYREADIQESLGELHLKQGRLDDAQSALVAALEMYRQIGLVSREATTQHSLGDLHLQQGRFDEAAAQNAFEAALELYRQTGIELGEALIQQILGKRLHLWRGNLDHAQSAFEAALELYRRNKETYGEADMQQSLGELHLRRGSLDDAQSAFEAALTLYQQDQETYWEAGVQQSLGRLHLQRGNLDDAQRAFEASLELYRQEEDTEAEAESQQLLGKLHLQQGRLDDAQSAFKVALQLYRHGEDPDGEAEIQQILGKLQQGRLDDAQSALEAALQLYRQAQDTYSEADIQESPGKLHLWRGRLNGAQSAFEAALELYRQAEFPFGEATIQRCLGQLHLQQGRLDDAQSALEAALELYRQDEDADDEAKFTQQLLDDLRTRKEEATQSVL